MTGIFFFFFSYSLRFYKVKETKKTQTGVTVQGADIRGNVYGGGNAAEVTGDANVVIGKSESTPSPNPAPTPTPEPTPEP